MNKTDNSSYENLTLEEAHLELEKAKANKEYVRASKLQYGIIPELEKARGDNSSSEQKS